MGVKTKILKDNPHPKMFTGGEFYVSRDGLVVLCTENADPSDGSFSGVVIGKTHDCRNRGRGEYDTCWASDSFEPFYGSIEFHIK